MRWNSKGLIRVVAAALLACSLPAMAGYWDGVSRSLPTTVHVPVISAVIPARAPATHATTGASGG